MVYVNDLVALKRDRRIVGLVEVTFNDVQSHQVNTFQHYSDGIRRGKGIKKSEFYKFLGSGVPPKGFCLVTWTRLPTRPLRTKSDLLAESELVILDRELLSGDVVRRKCSDRLSGTIVHTRTSVSLIPPLPWPAQEGRYNSARFNRSVGNYSTDEEDEVHNISTNDLTTPGIYHEEDIIVYKGWVGHIRTVSHVISIRLSNGSVVELDDEEALTVESQDCDDIQIGDFVSTTRRDLRDGNWVVGKYKASIHPSGYVVGVYANAIAVNWLHGRDSKMLDRPPTDLFGDILTSAEIRVLNRQAVPISQAALSTRVPKQSDLNVQIGDRVQFKHLSNAIEKYSPDDMSNNIDTETRSSRGQLRELPSAQNCGFDVNTFMISNTKTNVTVLWQDLSTSEHESVDLIPVIEFDDEDDTWPGELVMTKLMKHENVPHNDKDQADGDDEFGEYSPQRIGFVESVNAEDRLAFVRWCDQASVYFAKDDRSILIPGSRIGKLNDCSEECSLYDITSVPALSRGTGDLVMIIDPSSIDDDFTAAAGVYQDAHKVSSSPTASNHWFGEIVELGVNGVLTVRTGAAESVIDIRVPWDSTFLVYSADDSDWDEEEEEEDEEGDDDDDDDNDDNDDDDDDDDEKMEEYHDLDDPLEATLSGLTDESFQEDQSPHDEDGSTMLVGLGSPEAGSDELSTEYEERDRYETEHDDDSILAEDEFSRSDLDQGLTATAEDAAILESETMIAATAHQEGFTYAKMFTAAPQSPTSDALETSKSYPEPFKVLDGSPSHDHRFTSTHYPFNTSLKRILAEHKILRSSLPEGVFVRTWEENLNLLRVLILGPIATPYEYAPFVIDFSLDDFPSKPPIAHFHSWTDGSGPINPNLYENGKICLSLLGTWHGDKGSEVWSSSSTLLQVIVSLIGLVLVKEPYYNEAGYDVLSTSGETSFSSAMYTERAYLKARKFIGHAIRNPIGGLEDVISALYTDSTPHSPQLLARAIWTAIDNIRRSQKSRGSEEQTAIQEAKNGDRSATGGQWQLTVGALTPLRREVETLLSMLKEWHETMAKSLHQMLTNPDFMPRNIDRPLV